MVILDANVILRYLLNDNQEMAERADHLIQTEDVSVTIEVMAEVIYVLKGVYKVDRERIADTLLEFLHLVMCENMEVLRLALETFKKNNLDFVDCVLYSWHKIKNAEIATFDKKLLKLIESTE